MARVFSLYICSLFLLNACRHVPVVQPEEHAFGHGLFVLNEGNMGSNKASIDFLDIERDTFYRNVYPEANPEVIKELGDVGNDIAIYGSRLYAVINVSGKIEVMNTQAQRIGQVDVPNCRSICFQGAYAYVTSYAGPVSLDASHAQIGYVAKIDTATLAIVDTCHVGYQPNGIACDGNCLYVANSGGYMFPNYDSTVSVIALSSFHETKRITVAKNLDRIVYDAPHNALFVSSLGDYYECPACLYRIDLASGHSEPLNFGASSLCLAGNSLYYLTSAFTGELELGILNTATLQRQSLPIGDLSLITPYAIAVEYEGGDIYLTDARDYVTPGVLYRLSPSGTLLTSHRTGDIPGHLCFSQSSF